ncbi:ABC transporter substrate-binding protein, partial [Streptomyces sp. NPDC059956]
MTRKNVTRMAITTLVAGAFFATSACGMSGGAGDVKEGEKTGKVAGRITFRTLQLKPMFTSYVQGVIDAFEKQYPDAKVTWEDVPGDGYNEKIVADAQAGALPDVVNLSTDSFQLLGDRGMLADVAKLDPEVAKDYVPGAWEQFKLPGKG